MFRTSETENILSQFIKFNEDYAYIYAQYKTLTREDLRLQSGLLHDLFKRLNNLQLLFKDIEGKINNLPDEGLKFSFEDNLNDAKEAMTILEHCLNNRHIKNNWVRIRVWYSGFFNDKGNFSSTSIIGTTVSLAIDATKEYLCTTKDNSSNVNTKTNVGHVSLELPNGYFSFWPPGPEDSEEATYSLNTLVADKRDEGTTLEHQKLAREPDAMFEFYSLDVNKMDEFCRNYVRDEINYNLFSKKNNKNTPSSSLQIMDNCISSCLKILIAGGIDVLASGSQFINSISGIVTPRTFAQCLAEVKQNEVRYYPIIQSLKAPLIENPTVFKAGNTPLLVVNDYRPTNTLHLAANKGDVIVLEKIDDDSNYLHCRDKNNRHGIIHAAYVSFKTSFDTSNVVNESVSFDDVLKGLNYIKISDPSACLFQAIGLSMGQNATFIRNMMVHYLENNLAACRKFRPGKMDDFKSYINDIRNGNEWNDIIELQIIQSFLSRPIIVIRPDAQPLIPSNLEHYKRTPVFLYYDNGHYDYFTIQPNHNPQDILNNVQACLKTDEEFKKILAHSQMPNIVPQQLNNNHRRNKTDCLII